jgi:hypothetical protein
MKECDRILESHRQLIKSEKKYFPKKGSAIKVSTKLGVYIIFCPSNYVLHVGSTKRGKDGINQRLNDHRNGASSFSKNYLNPNKISLADGYYFKFIEIENSRERVLLEALTAGLLCPEYIGTGERSINKK